MQPLRLLIADDSEVVRRHLRDLLAPYAYTHVVAEAETADGALQLIERQAPDVVILDIQMPGGGIQALKAVKSRFPEVRVIMLTNHSEPYYRKVCLRAGADFFLDKSMEFEQVPRVLASIAGE